MLIDVVGNLGRDAKDPASRAPLRALGAELKLVLASARRSLRADKELLPTVREKLGSVQRDARAWQFNDDGWSLLATALERVVRNARAAFDIASESRSDEDLHEWRKQIKHVDYALAMIVDMRPGRLGALGEDAHRLAADLGDDHDLAVLTERLAGHSAADHSALSEMIRARRAELQDRAFTIGERLLFACKPKAFVSILEKDWRRWRG